MYTSVEVVQADEALSALPGTTVGFSGLPGTTVDSSGLPGTTVECEPT